MRRAQARADFSVFFRASWDIVFPGTPLAWGRHIQELCDTVQAQLEDRWRARRDPTFALRAQNVLINVPPRSLKTTILALATIWAWIHEPTMRILYISSNPTVLEDSARWAQVLILSEWFQAVVKESGQTWTLNPEQTALKNFGTTLGGTRLARGVDSNITGAGADWIIVDDPHDVRDSEDQIRSTCAGYDAALHNRINDPRTSIRTAIMQRFRVDDFSGHVLEHHGKGTWLHVRRPTEFRTRTSCTCGSCVGVNALGFADWRTVEGERIHPRYSDEFLFGADGKGGERKRLGPYGYAGQHDQEPMPPSGGMWKNSWWGWVALPEDPPSTLPRPHGCNLEPAVRLERRKARRLYEWITISVDGTFGNLKEHEGSACGLGIFGRSGQYWDWLEDQTEPISYLEAVDRIRFGIMAWHHEAPVHVLVEPKAFGPMAVEQLRRDLAAGKFRDQADREHPFTDKRGRRCQARIEVLKGADVDGEGRKGVQGDKVTRFYAASPTLAAGLVRLREGALWIPEALAETSAFNKGRRDDRVDIVTQLVNHYGEASDLQTARAMLTP